MDKVPVLVSVWPARKGRLRLIDTEKASNPPASQVCNPCKLPAFFFRSASNPCSICGRLNPRFCSRVARQDIFLFCIFNF